MILLFYKSPGGTLCQPSNLRPISAVFDPGSAVLAPSHSHRAFLPTCTVLLTRSLHEILFTEEQRSRLQSPHITAVYQRVTRTEHGRHCKRKKKRSEDCLSIKSVLSHDWCDVVRGKCCWRIMQGKLNAVIYSLKHKAYLFHMQGQY